MSGKKSSKQKNTRHHFSTASATIKKQSTKAKLRNEELLSRLDKTTGLAGAVNLFSKPKPSPPKKVAKEKQAETKNTLEDDMLSLMTLQLSSTIAH